MKKLYELLFFLTGLCLPLFIMAQPANDSCGAAIALALQPYGSSCTSPVAGTTAGATSSPFSPSCAGTQADDDVWYSFTAATESVIIRISNATLIPSGTATVSFALYESTCPASSASFICEQGVFFSAGYRIVNGLTAGNTYYLRLWSSGTTAGMNFNVCVQTVPAAPVNDECSGAVGIIINPFGTSCTSPVAVNTAGATQSVPGITCTGGENNDDVWYSFTATSQSILVRASNVTITSNNNAGSASFALYGGSCPVATTALVCDNGFAFGNGYKIVDGLIPGNIYYLRVWIAGVNNYGTMNLCVQEVPPPPPNDECSGAIVLTVNPFGTSCSNAVAVNTTGATQSTPGATCTANENNDDVWFSFTATSQSILVRVSNATITTNGNTASAAFALYDGNCPATTTALACDNGLAFGSGYKIADGLTPGNTYYLRIWVAGVNNYGTMNLCVQEVPPPPPNDECSGAIGLIVNPFGMACTNAVAVNTTGATLSTPGVTCTANENNDDVWYSFTATSQSILVRVSNATITTNGNTASAAFALYDGNCPATTTALVCDNGLAFGSGYKIADGLTPGNTYYLRVWAAGVNNYSTMNLCVQEVPPPPTNNECTGAIGLAVNPFGTACSNAVAVNTTGATLSTPGASCGANENNDDVWYSFTATSQSILVRVSNILITTNGNAGAASFALYGGTCPVSTTTVACDNGFAFNGGYKIVDGLIPGNLYYLRVWLAGVNNYGTMNLCVQEVPPSPANNECSGAIHITPAPPSTACLSPVIAQTTGATQSSPATSCQSTAINDDIWYSFTATMATHKISVTEAVLTTGNGNAGISYALYSSCPATTATIACANGFAFNNGNVVLNGLTPGNTYYLRFWSEGVNNYCRFKFCILETPQNNECTGAVNLPVGNGFCTAPVSGNLTNATISAGFGAPACAVTASAVDVWYKVTVPATGNVLVQTSAVNTTVNNLVMEAYSGGCGALTYIACDDNGNPEVSPSANHARLSLSGRTPGEVIYLRVMPFNGSNQGDFAICAWDTTASVLPPVAPSGSCTAIPALDISAVSGNRYMWVPLLDSAGRIVAEIFADGSGLNTINTSLYVNSGPVRSNTGKYFLDRNMTVTVSGTGGARVRWYIKNTELQALQTADPTVSGIWNLRVLKAADSCHSDYPLPGFSTITPAATAYGSDHYLQMTVSSFSGFYAEGKCGPTITWNGSVNTAWNDYRNWDCEGVPGPATTVVVPAGVPRYPMVTATTEIKRLELRPGASVTVQTGAELKVSGQ